MFGGRWALIGAVAVVGVGMAVVSAVSEGIPAEATPGASLSAYATATEIPVSGVTTVVVRFDPYVNGTSTVSISLSGGLVVASSSRATFSGTDDRGFARCTGSITATPGRRSVSGTATSDQTVFAEGLTDCDYSFAVTSDASGTGIVTASSSLGSFGFVPLDIGVSGPPVTSITPSSGPGAGGTKVTVVGSGFTRGTTVEFGTTPATHVRVTPGGRSLTCVLPPGTGPVDVTVTSPGDGLGIPDARNRFTYLAPTISSIVATSDRTTGGRRVVIAGTDLQGSTVTIGGTPSAGVKVLKTGMVVRAEEAAGSTGPVTVVVTTPAGSASTFFTSTP